MSFVLVDFILEPLIISAHGYACGNPHVPIPFSLVNGYCTWYPVPKWWGAGMAKRKRIGRPPKPAKERKSVNFTFRSRGELREQLRRAAEVSGRSISEEIEYRLDQSFR